MSATKTPIIARCIAHHVTMDAWQNGDGTIGWADHATAATSCLLVGKVGGRLRHIFKGRAVPDGKATT